MIEHVLDTQHRTVTCRATGKMTFVEACAALRFMVMTAREYRIQRTLITLGDSNAFVTPAEMLVLAPIIEACGDVLRKGRWAIIVPNSIALAMVRIALQSLKLSGPHVACFRYQQEAMIWLQEQPKAHAA